MTDNFDLIENLLLSKQLDFDAKSGDRYYVQLLARAADDPKVDSKSSKRYHGNMHSRSIKDYLIKSHEELEDLKDEIVTLCNACNVRAYIRLNKRNLNKMAKRALAQLALQNDMGTFSSVYNIAGKAAGKCNSEPKATKTWVLDMDAEHLEYEKDIVEMLFEMPEYSSYVVGCNKLIPDGETLEKTRELFKHHLMNFVPTKSGKHIICKPFNKLKFETAWKKFCLRIGKEVRMPDIHPDNPTILYVP